MCGILCCIGNQKTDCQYGTDAGDCQVENVCSTISSSESQSNLALMKKLLHSRGPDISSSATVRESYYADLTTIVHLSGDVLWTQGIRPEPQPYTNPSRAHFLLFNGDLYGEHESQEKYHDGLDLFHRLEASSTETEFLQVFSSLEGPFAFVYFEKPRGEIWFGRDFFGRESLLVSYDDPEALIISSISAFRSVFEVPTFGIYCYSIPAKQITSFQWESHPRDQINSYFNDFKTFLGRCSIHLEAGHSTIKCIPTLLKSISTNPVSDPVLSKLMDLCQVPRDEQLIHASRILESEISQFLSHLRSAVQKRVKVQPPYCKLCVSNFATCTHSKIGVLFSGGIDSTVLAYLAAESLLPGESLDLINVAFYQDDDILLKAAIPDRETGLVSFELLKAKFPQINFNFIPVNVTKSQIEPVRKNRIRHLLSPMNSVLDDSIGCCLWFAASGNSKSTARVLLLGSGADELLGGYSRFRTAYKNGGWESLRRAMQEDVDRISIRNLGRDNRIVSDHGVAPRMPFLDESVVRFLTTEVDLWVKCCPLEGLERGVGEKLLLRATALTLLGNQATQIALFPKRAMQFGSRIAKLENSKERGNQKCERLADIS